MVFGGVILLLEVGLRLAPGLAPASWQELPALRKPRVDDLFVYDSEMQFRLAPGLRGVRHAPSQKDVRFSVSTQSLGFGGAGFRDDGISPTEPIAVVVGDSFAFCWTELEECWVELLESSSERDFANLGMPGLGGRQQWLVLERYGLPLEPDLVIWTFFANDLYDNVRLDSAVRVDRWTWLERRSVLFGAVRQVARQSPPRPPPPPSMTRLKSSEPAFDDGVVSSTLYAEASLALWVGDQALGDGWQVQRDAVVSAFEASRRAGAQFAVVLMPFRELIYFDYYEEFAGDLASEDLLAPYHLMRRLCEDLEIPLVDGNEVMSARRSDQIFYRRDAHLNALGNRILAEEVERFLEHNGL